MSSVEPGADIREAHAELPLIGAQHRIGAGQGLEHGVVDMNAGLVHGGDHVLRCAGRGGHHVHADFEPRGHHAQRIVHSGLIVEDEFLGQQMENLAIGGKRDAHGRVSTACLISSRPISRGRVPRLMPP